MRTTTTGSMAAFAIFLITGPIAAAEGEASLGGVRCAAGDWPASGYGNHCAVVDVTTAADAARARIPWRRHDEDFRTKAVLVYDLAIDAKVNSSFACNLTCEYGDVVFQPPTAPGRYAVYYLPHQESYASGGTWNGGCLAPRLVAEPAWLAKHGPSAEDASPERITHDAALFGYLAAPSVKPNIGKVSLTPDRAGCFRHPSPGEVVRCGLSASIRRLTMTDLRE